MEQKAKTLVGKFDIVNPDIEFGIPRRVVGNLDLNITSSFKVEVYLEEYWYVMDEGQKLVIPTSKRLFSSKRVLLEQGKTIASAVANENGDFLIEWRDLPILYQWPWRTDIYLVNETYQPSRNLPPLTHFPQVTAYRMLTLRWFDDLVTSEQDRPRKRFPSPIPIIVFYGDEEEKNVGQLFSEVI